MKTLGAISAVLSLFLALSSQAAQTANVRMHCWSLRFQRATAVDGIGFEWRLGLTTLSVGLNGELALDFFGSGYTHSSYVDLYYEWDADTYAGGMVVDVPSGGDANGNGFPDFFEVSQPVNGLVSSGAFDCAPYFSNSELVAAWYRDAGSSIGYCHLSVPDPWSSFGNLTFVHSFELIEFNGLLSYTPGPDPITGLLSLSETNSSNALFGPVVFERSAADPYNELTLQSASLTNNSLGVLSLYTSSSVYREGIFPTNYFGNVVFQDGDLTTVEDDFFTWQLSLDDLNDADADGIPDFSDDWVPPPTPPELKVGLGASNVWITISGEAGHLIEIQSAGNPLATHWATVHSVTLTNDPQTESLPRPAVTTFWRAHIPSGQ